MSYEVGSTIIIFPCLLQNTVLLLNTEETREEINRTIRLVCSQLTNPRVFFFMGKNVFVSWFLLWSFVLLVDCNVLL